VPSLFVRDDLRRYTATYLTTTDIATACPLVTLKATTATDACYYRIGVPDSWIAGYTPLRPRIRTTHPYILFNPGMGTMGLLADSVRIRHCGYSAKTWVTSTAI